MAYAALYYIAQLGDVWQSGDFAALWSYGQILRGDGATALYDPVRLHALQTALGLPADQRNPFPYPPGFLPVVWPLGLLGFGAAFVAWTGVTIAAFVFACRGRLAWVALIAPGTTIGVIAGQSGFLSGALFVGGMRLVSTRPWLGGALLGLLTFKPQLGLLIPVALLASRAWRAVAGATIAAIALAGVSLALFGAGVGGLWLAGLPAYAADFADRSIRYGMMPTTTANLAMLGVPHDLAALTQLACAMGAAVLVWRVFRGVGRGAELGGGQSGRQSGGQSGRQSGGRELLVLAAATFIATPHAFVYDLPLLTGAALVYGADGRGAIIAAVLILPAAMLWSGPVPISTPVLVGVLAALCWPPSSGRSPQRFSTACSSTSAANTAMEAIRTPSSLKKSARSNSASAA